MNRLRIPLLSSTKLMQQFIRHESHKKKLQAYMENEKHLKEMLQFIPSKYLAIKKYYSLDNLYLIDTFIARDICRHILPALKDGNQLIAETGAGLGLVASELLDNNVKSVRLYECCADFREALHDFNTVYPGRVELFTKNLFHLGRISVEDKYDRGNRVSQMLKNVPRKAWSDGPCLTVFGCMVNKNFISYLLKMMALQAEIVAYGRIQMFVVMRPADFIKLTAGPNLNLHTYQPVAVLFQNLFDYKLIDKYPRQAFLPWEREKTFKIQPRYSETVDVGHMYFVEIAQKKSLPLKAEQIMSFYFFMKQCFGRGKNRVIPTIEKWLPGCGKKLILPSTKYAHYFEDINIFTTFGEMTPQEILSIFHELIEFDNYKGSSFEAMIQSELVKYETRESDQSFLLEDSLDSIDIEDLEEKFDEMIEFENYKGSSFEAMIQLELVEYETRESNQSFLLEDSLDSIDIEDLEEKFE